KGRVYSHVTHLLGSERRRRLELNWSPASSSPVAAQSPRRRLRAPRADEPNARSNSQPTESFLAGARRQAQLESSLDPGAALLPAVPPRAPAAVPPLTTAY